jgi:hypothetical protein
MSNDQWMQLWEETVTPLDLRDHLQHTELLLQQGLNLWTSLQSFAQSWAFPQTWVAASVGMAGTWDAVAKEWAGWVVPSEEPDLRDTIAEMENARDLAEAKLKEQKQELSKIRRAMAQKEKALNRRKLTEAQQRADLAEKEKLITKLKKTLDLQTARLELLEKQSKSTHLPPQSTHLSTRNAIPPGESPKAGH